MDFATLKGLTIPEGKVKQITDASGNVLWSAAAKTATITITTTWNGITGNQACITIYSDVPFAPDPSNPSNMTTGWSAMVYDEPNCTIELAVGTVIHCEVGDSRQSNRCYVTLNGVEVLSDPGEYIYTVARDAAIHMEDKYEQGEYGMIHITEQEANV